MTTTLGFKYNIDELYREAQTRWLKPEEVMYILQNHQKYQFTEEPPYQPTSGSLFLFNVRAMRFFGLDGHNWRKKRDGRTVGEAQEQLKVGNVEAINCYYAHGEQNPTFQRRSYWMLDPAYDHIVLVHYRETSEGRSSSGPGARVSLGSSSAEFEADVKVCSVSNANLTANEDWDSLKGTLAAVRNAAQAANRIRYAFRAHSFRKRRAKEAAARDLPSTSGMRGFYISD